ncbi:MAG: Fis family two component sigma-54 specific transcriptional regulator [Candidatus Magnetoglobus multicellularis str. Araruama]|uniref:Fis family two component sigma-54 specific transcriptional regulator n=1 Tax=Candidatus Magnetoglobus multicellularis str. Araruama TaxID=890399 RepID=A0A1V1PII3_9BACT|nr:MAG: Fis family two component sigma-54 specific transcriptional regulator [Candidatus Magnetoglobus multicellularis str. Araruama]
MERILIVDDEKNYPFVLSAVFEEEGYNTVTASSGVEALEKIKAHDIDLVLTDIKMPGMDGMTLMSHIKAYNADIPIIMMTAHGTVEKGEEAVKKGAHSYIFKPFQNEQLLLSVKIALNMYQMMRMNKRLQKELQSRYNFGNLIGKSKNMRDIFQTIQKVAPTNATVLIEGESGTGKELVAKSVHFNSTRHDAPFIAVNCSALAENLLESELFGHEKGAFTGASALKKGRFEIAEHGTLFLDEIGELSPNLQVKLLRVLQERSFERVGGVELHTIDARLIAATNKNLALEMKEGRFREDLYYRLNVVHFSLPPLRKRYEDIPLLAAHFLKKYETENARKIAVSQIDQDVLRLFYDYEWPGNIRELENIIERAVILSNTDTIKVSDIPVELRGHSQESFNPDDISIQSSLPETLALIEKNLIQRALIQSNNVQSKAAQILGIKKSLLHYKIKNYQIQIGSKN